MFLSERPVFRRGPRVSCFRLLPKIAKHDKQMLFVQPQPLFLPLSVCVLSLLARITASKIVNESSKSMCLRLKLSTKKVIRVN